jgi:cyanoexosortase A
MNGLPFWLLSLGASLIALHLNLTLRSDNSDLFGCSLLFWLTASYLIWDKRKYLKLESNLLASTIGFGTIALVLVKSLNVFGDDVFLRIFPLLSIFGWGSIASGFKGLKQYWQALLLFGFLAVPWELIYLVVDLSLLTAKFSVSLLLFLGFSVARQGILLRLPTGSIEVYDGCSGIRLIFQLLGISLIFIVLVSVNKISQIILIFLAIFLGFVVNGVRVALLAVLAGLSDPEILNYWHLGNGSLIFSLLAVIILSLFLFVVYHWENIR